MDPIRWRNGLADPFRDFEVLCDVRGLAIGDVEICVAGSVLTLKGEQKADDSKNGERTCREEMRIGRFQRTLQLPIAIDPDKGEAVLEKGILTLTLDLKEQVKPRTIQVRGE